jgi:hypothetical protein
MAATLSACTEGTELNFMQNSGAVSSKRAPLTQAQMMRGAVTLVPPSGYCIDPSSLKQNFALMARCDTLGGKNGALDAPLGVMTVSLAAVTEDDLKLLLVAKAADGTTLGERFDTQGIEMARAKTSNPEPGLSQTHWRAVTKINVTNLSVALFAPSESPALGGEGRSMIRGMINASQSASVATSVASGVQPKDTKKKKGLRATLAGLFE